MKKTNTNMEMVNTNTWSYFYDLRFSFFVAVLILVFFIVSFIYLRKTLTRYHKYGIWILLGFIFYHSIYRVFAVTSAAATGLSPCWIKLIYILMGGIAPLITSKALLGCSGQDTSFNKNDIITFVIGILICYIYVWYFFDLHSTILNICFFSWCDVFLKIKEELCISLGAANKLIKIISSLVNNLINNLTDNNKITMGPSLYNTKKEVINTKSISSTTCLMEGSNSDPNMESNSEPSSSWHYSSGLGRGPNNSYRNPNIQYLSVEQQNVNSQSNNNVQSTSTSQNSSVTENWFKRFFYKRNGLFYNLFEGNAVHPRRGMLLYKNHYIEDYVPSQTLDQCILAAREFWNELDIDNYRLRAEDIEHMNHLKRLFEQNFQEIEIENIRFHEAIDTLTPEEREQEQEQINAAIESRKNVIEQIDLANMNIKNMRSLQMMYEKFLEPRGKYNFKTQHGEDVGPLISQLRIFLEDLPGISLEDLTKRNHPGAPNWNLYSKKQITEKINTLILRIQREQSTLGYSASAIFLHFKKLEEYKLWMTLKSMESTKNLFAGDCKFMRKLVLDRDYEVFQDINSDPAESDSDVD